MAEKRVFFYRHGPKEKGPKTGGGNLAIPLTQEGAEKMMSVAKSHVQRYGRPDAIWCSPALRAYQTAMLFAVQDNDMFLYPVPYYTLIGQHDEWETFSPTCKTALEFYRDKPDLMMTDATAMWGLIMQCFVGAVSGEASIVVVGHGGLIETVAAVATCEASNLSLDIEAQIPAESLKEGEAIMFVFSEAGKFLRYEFLRNDGPTADQIAERLSMTIG